MQIVIPITDLKDVSSASELCKQSREPVLVTKNGRNDMVIMSIETYGKYMHALEACERLAQMQGELG